ASAKDWQQKDHRAAIDKLGQALAIYDKTPGDWQQDRAVVMRAIVWNEVEAGDAEAGLVWFEKLIRDLPRGDEEVPAHRELGSAYAAIYEAATRRATLEERIATIDRAHAVLLECRHVRRAAQCLHDKGTLYGQAGDVARMRPAFAAATAQRRQLADSIGLAWTLNNLAHFELESGDVDEAASALQQGYELIARGEGLEAQRALAFNLDAFYGKARASAPSSASVEAMWNIARSAGKSRLPFVVPPDRMLRESMQLQLSQRGDKAALAIARRAAKLVQPHWPVEVRADSMLRIAAMALRGGRQGCGLAQTLLRGLAVGDGPCAAHLAARRDAIAAVVAAHSRRVEDYDRLARTAADAMTGLGDRQGRIDLLRQLSEVEIAAGKSTVHDALGGELDELLQSGGPGGDGAAAMSQGVGQPPADADEHTTFAAIEPGTEGGSWMLTDRIGGGAWKLDLRWKPHNSSFNGIGLGLHGGYFVVRSMQYGGAAASGGAVGQTSLDELGNYLPISSEGHWEITRNGATRFVPRS
ncbi:MAG: hypothetical protein KDC98_00870, partial [Planctomycetes bacterium]|nr:hypothetical protein [Planctomycetota bacterium]